MTATSVAEQPRKTLGSLKWLTRMRHLLEVVAAYGGLLLVWEWLGRLEIIDTFFFPLPSSIASTLWRLWLGGDIIAESWVTLLEMSLGFVAGAILGVTVGLVLVRVATLYRIFQPAIYFLYSMPRIALAPLFIVTLGLGIESKIALVTFAVFFLVLINTIAGAQSIAQDYVRSATALGASPRQITWKVTIPGTVAWIFSALRLSVSIAFLSAVVAEFVGAVAGLGYRLHRAAVYFNTPEIFAWLVVLGTFSALIALVVGFFEKRALKWRP